MAEPKVNVNSVEKGDGFSGGDAPIAGDPQGAFMGMVSDLRASTKVTPTPMPVKLAYLAPDEFRFRTRTGYRNTAIKLRIYERNADDLVDAKNKDRFKKWAKRQGLDYVKDLKVDEDVYAQIGEPYIQFKPVRGVAEATYTTKDAFIASYIRKRIATGEFRDVIYEDVRPVEIEINGVKGLFAPIDDATREALAYAQAGD